MKVIANVWARLHDLEAALARFTGLLNAGSDLLEAEIEARSAPETPAGEGGPKARKR